MKLSRRFVFVSAAIAAMAALPGLAAAQQAYPSKPITMIVPFAAGGSTDVIGRILSERMRASLGQPIIIENATGAGGTIGVGRAVRAAPDGYTISLGQNGSHVITGATYNNLSYNLLDPFRAGVASGDLAVRHHRDQSHAREQPARADLLPQSQTGAHGR